MICEISRETDHEHLAPRTLSRAAELHGGEDQPAVAQSGLVGGAAVLLDEARDVVRRGVRVGLALLCPAPGWSRDRHKGT